MSKKDQLDKNYEDLDRKIEQAAEAEIKRIREKIEALKKEAREMAESVELMLAQKETKATKKKD